MNEKKNIPDSEVEELIEHLRGTVIGLYEACEAFGFDQNDLTIEQLSKIDEEIFVCSGCGWWNEISERNDYDDEPYCDNCIEDVRDDEDEEEEY